jgi:phage replication initiation protein
MGVHVRIPGEAFRNLPMGEDQLIAEAFACGGHMTRLDVAVDATGPRVEDFRKAWQAGQLVTKAQTVQNIGKSTVKGKPIGDMMMIGSRQGQRSVRIYDKQLEQASKGKQTATTSRVEVELHDEQADSAARHLVAGERFQSIVAGCVDFREAVGTDKHKERRPRLDWWEQLLGAIDKLRIAGGGHYVPSVDQVEAWLVRQCAPSLAVLLAARGGDVSVLLDMVTSGRHRWRSRHEAMLAGSLVAA